MPKYHDLKVSGGDRESLLRFALIARLVTPEGQTRRGAPKLPETLAPVFKSQRVFTEFLYRPVLLDAPELAAIVKAIDEGFPGERRVDDLHRALAADRQPKRVTAGVDAGFWPALKPIPLTRTPADTVMASCAAAAYLQTHKPDLRDLQAIRRLQKSLSRIATRHYEMSSRCVDLLAVLLVFGEETPLAEMRYQPRLARALDRGLRTYARADAWITHQDDLASKKARFDEMHIRIATEVVRFVNETPLTATSSSAALLRLIRVIIRYGDNSPTSTEAVGELIQFLFATARGAEYGKCRWRTTDVLLRREAAWYLIELTHLLPEFGHKIVPLLNRERFGDIFGDIISLVGSTEKGVRNWINQADLPAPEREPIPEDIVRPPRFPHDLILDRRTYGRDWPSDVMPFGEALERHLSRGQHLGATAWRKLTRQIALPTRDLLYELLVIPASGRARTIADTLRTSGEDVRKVTTQVLETMLLDDAVRATPIIARRALWAIGFIGDSTRSLLNTLKGIAGGAQIEHEIAAEAAWCLGEVLATRRPLPGRFAATQFLHELVRSALEQVEEAGDLDEKRRRALIAEAALRSLAIQRDPSNAAVFVDFYRDSGGHTIEPQDPSAQYQDPLGHARYFAWWGVNALDSPPVLAPSFIP